MRGFAVMLLVSLVTTSDSIAAQRNQPFETGELLRITAPACGIEEQIARYLRLYRDTLTVQADSQLALPVAGVTRLDVSRGVSNRTTLAGIAAGAFAGVLIGIAAAPDEDSNLAGGAPRETAVAQARPSIGSAGSHAISGAVVGPIAGAFIGGFLGGLVGKAVRQHRWEEVPLDRLRVSIAPRSDGSAVFGLTVSF